MVAPSKEEHLTPATTLKDAWNAFDPRPVESGNPYFVELTAARGSQATLNLKKMIGFCAENRFASIAFTGHRGSGKSTELLHLQKELNTSCFSIYVDVVEFLDVFDLDYTDLFLLVARRVIDELSAAQVQLNSNLLKGVEDWFRSVTKESEESVSLSAGIATEAKAGIEIPFVARLLAKLTADLKTGSSTKVKTREDLDRYFSGLVANTNLLLTAAAQALHDSRRPSRILILFDNLDRVPLHKSEELFFTHGSQLQNFACHAVYTIAIDTYYSRRGIATVFPQNVILPNVKLTKGKGDATPNKAGIDSLAEIVEKRIDVKSLLEDHVVLQRAIQLSGGRVSQLMRLMGQAVLSSSARNIAKLDAQAIGEGALDHFS